MANWCLLCVFKINRMLENLLLFELISENMSGTSLSIFEMLYIPRRYNDSMYV